MKDTSQTPKPAKMKPTRKDRWTPEKMAGFLRQLAVTNNVSAAARSVGMSRQSAYRLRTQQKGRPFDIGWEAAFQHGYDNLAQVALERALNGVEVPHYYQGELVGTSRKFDERLTIALLAMRNRFGAPVTLRNGAAAEFHSEYWEELLDQIAEGQLEWEYGEDAESAEDKIKALTHKHAPEERGRRW